MSEGGFVAARTIKRQVVRPSSARPRRSHPNQTYRRRRPISANPRLKHKTNEIETKEAANLVNARQQRPPRQRPASAVSRVSRKNNRTKKRIGWRPARSAVFDRHVGPNEVEALKEQIKETKMQNQQLLVEQRVNQANTRRLQSELNRADQKLESVLVGSGPHNSMYLETIRQMRKLRIKVHDLQQAVNQRDKKIEALLRNEKQSHVMELEVQNQEFYGQIVYLRAALQEREETIRKEQLSSLATVEASYRLADDVTSLQIAKRKVEDELHQTRAQLDRAISITNKDGSVVSVFDLIEELQAKLQVQREQNAKLRTEANRFRSYLQQEEVQSPPERRKRTLKTKQKQAMERLTTLPGWKDKLTPDISGQKSKRTMRSPTRTVSTPRREPKIDSNASADLNISLGKDGNIEIESPNGKNGASSYEVETPSALGSTAATFDGGDNGDDDGDAGDGDDDDDGETEAGTTAMTSINEGKEDSGDNDEGPFPLPSSPSPEASPKPAAAEKDDEGGFDDDDGDDDGDAKEEEPTPKPAAAAPASEKDDDGGFDDDDGDGDGAFEKDIEPAPKPAAEKKDDDGFDDDDDDDGFEKDDEPTPKPAPKKPAAEKNGDDDDGFDDDDDGDGDGFEKDDEPTPKPADKPATKKDDDDDGFDDDDDDDGFEKDDEPTPKPAPKKPAAEKGDDDDGFDDDDDDDFEDDDNPTPKPAPKAVPKAAAAAAADDDDGFDDDDEFDDDD